MCSVRVHTQLQSARNRQPRVDQRGPPHPTMAVTGREGLVRGPPMQAVSVTTPSPHAGAPHVRRRAHSFARQRVHKATRGRSTPLRRESPRRESSDSRAANWDAWRATVTRGGAVSRRDSGGRLAAGQESPPSPPFGSTNFPPHSERCGGVYLWCRGWDLRGELAVPQTSRAVDRSTHEARKTRGSEAREGGRRASPAC